MGWRASRRASSNRAEVARSGQTRLGPLSLALALLVGCSAETSDAGEPVADAARPPPPPTLTVPLTLSVSDAVQAVRPVGPVLVLAEPVGGGARQAYRLADGLMALGAAPESPSLTLDLEPGLWRLTAFVDRDQNGAFDGCPFPPSPEDPLTADRRDNVYAVRTVQVDPPAAQTSGAAAMATAPLTVELPLERQLCGPGAADTGIAGILRRPVGVDAVAEPAWLLIEPMPSPNDQAGEEPVGGAPGAESAEGLPSMRAPLRLPLLPAGLDRDLAFTVGSLLPGDYRLTFFVDADRDGRPSPCGLGIGGGDRFWAVHPAEGSAVRVVAGARTPVDVRLGGADCPEALTGLTVPIALSPAVEAALADGRLDPLAPLRLAFYDAAGAVVANLAVSGGLARRSDPVTITGLPPQTLRAVAWLDRDGDGLFGPCGGVGGGFDVASTSLEGLRVAAGQVTPIEPMVLALADCDLETSGLRGQVQVAVEPGAEGSGRPVRLELLGADGTRLGLPLIDNHWRLASLSDFADSENGSQADSGLDGTVGPRVGRYAVTAEVAPGRYRVVIYLDTDRDGSFGPCTTDGFGDRAAAGYPSAPEIEIEAGRIVDLGETLLTALDCPVAEASVAPVAAPDALVAALAAQLPLRLLFEEAGGWREAQAGHPGWDAEAAVALAPRRLAPGAWRLTAYFDSDDDGEYRPDCAGLNDVLAGQVDFVLDAARPDATPRVQITAACGP